ncbi:hypothetical protein TrST_g8840 [Triparma strigata]|uniref:Nudix hydrolase domain-containing protein n=1 Tax=Triparma strigata TaxID=1606541 RepID=A0A9W7ADD8_9STRA|nr:hypothetical protein TrST_g8840 [Triparma strigata]
MRYPGEWKFPGGQLNPQESPRSASLREFTEEFLTPVPPSAKIRLFKISQTRPILGVSHLIYNFICLESENPWLKRINVETINKKLDQKVSNFEAAGSSFHTMKKSEKLALSPEVKHVEWLDMSTSLTSSFTSMNSDPTFVNAWQEKEFTRLNIKRRDPMFVNLTLLKKLEDFKDEKTLIEWCDGLKGREEEEIERIQWLEDGMEVSEVDDIIKDRNRTYK